MKKEKQKKEANRKFSLKEMIWIGFNYTCGIAFTSAFATFMITESGKGYSLGMHMIWIFLVEGLVAGTCAWAFNRLSRVHEGGNGGAYIYVRTNWGKFWGWFISFLQYTTLPIIVTSQIVSMVRLNFVGSSTFLDTADSLGKWANITWDAIGVVIYMLVSCVIFLGMKFLRYFINASGYIKWGSTILLALVLISMCFINGTDAWKDNAEASKITPATFSSAFASCFFFFLGFETYATMGNNVENPEKNIGKSIIWIMILATLFYVIVTILFLGAIAVHFSSNPNLQLFTEFGDKVGAKWVGVIGVVIMLICTVSLKVNAGMQNALYSGTILEPHAKEGILPEKFAEVNKDGIPFKASILNLTITFIFAVIWLFIPDLIQAITGGDAVFSYASITGEASLIMILIFAFVIATALKLSFQKDQNKKPLLKSNWFEKLVWLIVFLFLIWQFVQFFIDLISGADGFITAFSNLKGDTETRSAGIATIVSNSLELGYIIGVILFAVLWYVLKYKPMAEKRLIENPEIQKELDSHFTLKEDSLVLEKLIDN